LLTWYRRTARDLPWRRTCDPYRIWVSEILLQQTRVETVISYYQRFLAAFPTVQVLAAAPLTRVLRLWAGLGYYSRARHLHRAARLIASERGGRFPATAAQWQELPGVGAYTAGAVASIAFGERVPAVDGNVKRVLARLSCIRQRIGTAAFDRTVGTLAGQLVPRGAPGEFNQALMELGARVCLPRRPRCDLCPVRHFCAAHAAGCPSALPLRARKPRVRSVRRVAAAVWRNGAVLLVRRPATGLLAGLWTLPGAELRGRAAPSATLKRLARESLGGTLLVGPRVGAVQHAFSHQSWRVDVYACDLDAPADALSGADCRWVSRARLAHFPLAAVDCKLLQLGEERGKKGDTTDF
jgi:A/G-specific adenine glycosylase